MEDFQLPSPGRLGGLDTNLSLDATWPSRTNNWDPAWASVQIPSLDYDHLMHDTD